MESKVRPKKRALGTERAENVARGKNLDQPKPKKTKNIKNEPSEAVVTNGVECLQPEKPLGIGQPCAWCEVSRTFRKREALFGILTRFFSCEDAPGTL